MSTLPSQNMAKRGIRKLTFTSSLKASSTVSQHTIPTPPNLSPIVQISDDFRYQIESLNETEPAHGAKTPGEVNGNVNSQLISLTTEESTAIALEEKQLELNTINIVQAKVRELNEGTSTTKTYKRHLKRYLMWIEKDGKQPWPITACKVALFALYEMNRPQERRIGNEYVPVEGTNMGRDHVLQVVSALEHFRKETEHTFDAITYPLAHAKLRDHQTVRNVEKLLRSDEVSRQDTNQSLKAGGSLASKYTVAERLKLSQYFFEQATNSSFIAAMRYTRDALALKLCYAMALRGDNMRRLCWSDIQVHVLPGNYNRPELEVMVFLSNNGKQNHHARVDTSACIRHLDILHCPVFNTILLLFFQMDFDSSIPAFEPDFEKQEWGYFGYRPWYDTLPLRGASRTEPMVYATHNSIVKKAHEACDIPIWKTTHGGRTSAGVDMGLANVEEGEKKAMGLWQRDSFNSCYGTNIATQGVSALAGADPQYIRATYWSARFDIAVPKDVETLFFRSFETIHNEYLARRKNNERCRDEALRHLCNAVLNHFRKWFAQDLICFQSLYPKHRVFHHPLFQSDSWKRYSVVAQQQLDTFKTSKPLENANLPENIINAFQQSLNHFGSTILNGINKRLDTFDPPSSQPATKKGRATDSLSNSSPLAHSLPSTADHESCFEAEKTARNVLKQKLGKKLDGLEIIWNGKTAVPLYVPKMGMQTVYDVVNEWRRGVKDGFSIQELNHEFGSAWKNNKQSLHTEMGRRKAVVDAICQIEEVQKVTEAIAIKILENQYPKHTFSVGTIGRDIQQKKAKEKKALKVASSTV